jgi:hypothetical protein
MPLWKLHSFKSIFILHFVVCLSTFIVSSLHPPRFSFFGSFSSPLVMSVPTAIVRKSRRLSDPSSLPPDELIQLVLPEGCDLVANTFVVFKWQDQCCLLQTNLTLYCWGGRRSGALEHVLEKYDWTHSPQLHRINSKVVSDKEWSWLKQIFVMVHRMFDEKETGDTVSKIHWLNIVECRLAYDLLRENVIIIIATCILLVVSWVLI